MAPVLGEDWEAQLRVLPATWDGYKGRPITEQAIATMRAWSTVPCSDGGIQLEIHQDSYDIEIVIAPNGELRSVVVAHEK